MNAHTGYDSRYPNAPLAESYPRNYPREEQCEATLEPVTNQISNRLDQALKLLDMLHGMTRERADQLIGPEQTNKLSDSNCKTPPTLDRGVMDRIIRQTKEVVAAIESLEREIRRFHQL